VCCQQQPWQQRDKRQHLKQQSVLSAAAFATAVHNVTSASVSVSALVSSSSTASALRQHTLMSAFASTSDNFVETLAFGNSTKFISGSMHSTV